MDVLPVILPLSIAALVFALVCFGHLAFKNIPINRVNVAIAVLSVPFSLFFMRVVNIAIVDFGVSIFILHFTFLICFFCLVFVRGFFKVKRLPSLIQMVGPIVMLAGVYFFLA